MKPRAISYIRFSTKLQGREGKDSLRRQEALFNEFVEENDLEVLTELHVRDLGVSGYTGANFQKGLKDIVDYIDEGKIKSGDYLCIESLDRLSRANVWASIGMLTQIVLAGVKVATLSHSEKRVYEKDSPDVMMQLLFSVMVLSRANEESAIKSKRLQSVWSEKRKNAGEKPVTTKCPGWLRISDVGQDFCEIPERVEIIRQIFDFSDAGIGSDSIAKVINGKGIKPFSARAKVWGKSYIDKILSNRSVLGEFQPHRTFYERDSKGIQRFKRVPDGDPIYDYFPSIIDESLFRRVNAKRSERAVSGAGRKGPTFSNLISGLGKCAYCGSGMNMVNKGQPPKGYRYLVCYSAMHGGGCKYSLWRYDSIESLLLHYLKEIPLDDLTPDQADPPANAIRETQLKLSDRLLEVSEIRTNIVKSIQTMGGRISKSVNDQLLVIEEEEEKLKESLKEVDSQLLILSSEEESIQSRKEQLTDLINHLGTSSDTERLEIRAKLHHRIKDAVQTIHFFPQGFLGFGRKSTKSSTFRFFFVKFKNGRGSYFAEIQKEMVKIDYKMNDNISGNFLSESKNDIVRVDITDMKSGEPLSAISPDLASIVENQFREEAIKPFSMSASDKQAAQSRFKAKIKKFTTL